MQDDMCAVGFVSVRAFNRRQDRRKRRYGGKVMNESCKGCSFCVVQTIIDSCKSGPIDAEVLVIICNNSKATAMERARREGIPCFHLSSKTHIKPDDLDAAITSTLVDHGVELVALVGYMKKLGHRTLVRYRRRLLNVPPPLLP